MQRVSNKEVNIGDVYVNTVYPGILGYNGKLIGLYYQVVKRTGKYQVKLRAIHENPFLYSNRDPSLPFIKDCFLNDLPPENTLYEFKAWVLGEYGLKMVGSFLSWELWKPYMEDYRE